MTRWAFIHALALALSPIVAVGQSPGALPEPESALRPGDVIRIQIWREETLSGDFAVAQDGTVVLPKIGRYDVTQEAPEALRDRFLEDYLRYLRNPSIEITFLRRITILGAVREAGLKLVDPTMTVADALALAGGTTPDGRTDQIHVIRNGERIQTVTDQMRIVETPLRSGDQLFVPERSWPSRNPGVVAAVISSVVSIAIALLAR